MDECGYGSVRLGLEVEKGVFFDEVVKESLPVLKNGDPLIVLQRADVPNVLESEEVLDLFLDDLEDAGQHGALLKEDALELTVSLSHLTGVLALRLRDQFFLVFRNKGFEVSQKPHDSFPEDVIKYSQMLRIVLYCYFFHHISRNLFLLTLLFRQ